MGNDRHQNPPTARKGPDRGGGSWARATSSGSAAADGVRMGYDIIDRHTQEGRQEAWRRTSGSGHGGWSDYRDYREHRDHRDHRDHRGYSPGFDPMAGGRGAWSMPDLASLLGPWLSLLQLPARMFEGSFGRQGWPPPRGGWNPFTPSASRPPPGQPTEPPPAQQWAHGSYVPQPSPPRATRRLRASQRRRRPAPPRRPRPRVASAWTWSLRGRSASTWLCPGSRPAPRFR